MPRSHLFVLGLTSLLFVCPNSLVGEEVSLTTPAEILRKGKSGMSEGEVRIRGVLVNKGSNYFTDQKLVLRDSVTGAEIYVRPWLPLQVVRIPGRDYSSADAPPVQSEFLNKEVILTGHFLPGELRNVGVVSALSVDEAQIVGD